MCGIVGYLGSKTVVPLLLDSLQSMEYRGYDSAGVAFITDKDGLTIYKSSGKLANLRSKLPPQYFEANGHCYYTGIGHTRWATHGGPSDENAHPHLSSDNTIAVIHNGIIENYGELREELTRKGYKFRSKTDTECVALLLEDIAKQENDFLSVVQKAVKRLKGAYALVILNKHEPEKLYGVRNHAPLVVGVGQDEMFMASDAVALIQHTNRVCFLKDGQMVEVTRNGYRVYNFDGQTEPTKEETLECGPLVLDKKGFKHYMLKEIHEQPDVIRHALDGRLVSSEEPIYLFSQQEQEILKGIERIAVVACGTSLNAGLVGKYFIEEIAQTPVDVEAAGEFRYRHHPLVNDKTLVVAISQSGETADTIQAIRQSKQNGAKVLAVTNREDSTIAREADIVLSLRAGIEVSVCATKSFVAQVMILYLLGMHLAESRRACESTLLQSLKLALQKLPVAAETILASTEPLQQLARKYGYAKNVFFIARGINFPVALEGALKLKEISYIHAEGYSASELKHGPIAMLDADIPVIAILTPGVVYDKMISNCQEAKARDAKVMAVNSGNMPEDVVDTFEDIVYIPTTEELLSPILTVIPLQLLAYYIAEYLGKDVDQPRNLAKSVTVE